MHPYHCDIYKGLSKSEKICLPSPFQIDDLLGEKRYAYICIKQTPVLDNVCLKVMYSQNVGW